MKWNIHLLAEKGDAYNISFFGSVEQTIVKTETLIRKLERAGINSTAEITLVEKGLKVFLYRNKHWSTTIDGLAMGFSTRPSTQPPVPATLLSIESCQSRSKESVK